MLSSKLSFKTTTEELVYEKHFTYLTKCRQLYNSVYALTDVSLQIFINKIKL